MITGRDLDAIACVLRKTRPLNDDDETRDAWTQTVVAMCDMLATNNPKFQRNRFCAAATLEPR